LIPFHSKDAIPIKNAIALVRRGGCRVTIKSRNAQLAGAKMIIIVDDIEQELGDQFGHEDGGLSYFSEDYLSENR